MKVLTRYALAILILSFAKVNAQKIALGTEADIITSSVKINNIPNSAIQTVNGKNIMGYEVGPYLKVGLGSVYIKPKLLISHQNGMSNAVYTDGNETSVNVDVTKLDIPVLLDVKIIGPLNIEGGPVYNRILTATKDFSGNSISMRPDGVGYHIGVNAQLAFIGLNVAYEVIKNGSSGSLSSYETPDMLIFGVSLGF